MTDVCPQGLFLVAAGFGRGGECCEKQISSYNLWVYADEQNETSYGVSFFLFGMDENMNLKEIADSCAIVPGSYKKMTPEEMLTIFEECR